MQAEFYQKPNRTNEWATPKLLFDTFNLLEGEFTLDAAASESNAKCERYYTRENSAFHYLWSDNVWLNPPYDEIPKWLEKVADEVSDRGCKVTCLLPSLTEKKWFHEHVLGSAKTIYFLRKRIRFENQSKESKSGAPFASVVAVFHSRPQRQRVLGFEL